LFESQWDHNTKLGILLILKDFPKFLNDRIDKMGKLLVKQNPNHIAAIGIQIYRTSYTLAVTHLSL